MTVKGIAFDLDGTLVDSLPGLTAALDSVMQEHELPAPGSQLTASWVGNGVDTLLQRALIWAERPKNLWDLAAFRECFTRYYTQQITQGTVLYPEVKKTLEILKQQGFMLAIISNKQSQFIPPLLEKLGIGVYFSITLGADDVKMLKPHPAPIYHLLAQWGLRASELLLVGDSRNDILAARAAGSPSVGVTYGYNHGEPIALSQPEYMITHFSQLLELLVSPITKGRVCMAGKNKDE